MTFHAQLTRTTLGVTCEYFDTRVELSASRERTSGHHRSVTSPWSDTHNKTRQTLQQLSQTLASRAGNDPQFSIGFVIVLLRGNFTKIIIKKCAFISPVSSIHCFSFTYIISCKFSIAIER